MTVPDKMFQDVPLNTQESNLCSPKDPGPRWRGIQIQAPTRVMFDRRTAREAFVVLPVCGFYTLQLDALDSGPMMLIVTDRATRQVYRGAVVDADPNPIVRNPLAPQRNPAKPRGALSSYFNPNVARYVEFPMRSASYEVVVEYGGMRSNSVTVEVIVAP